jgi:hypothetical protein
MYKLVEWTPELDLTDFYVEAQQRGFVNNSSQKAMIDCFRNEREWKVWILYQDDHAIGSVAAHSFDDVMGPNSYRICARTCSFAEAVERKGLLTFNKLIREHQNFTAQFFIPAALDWTPPDADLYITSNYSKEASQRLVHRMYMPGLVKNGTANRIKDVEYRGHIQTVWKLNRDVFVEQLNQCLRWA